MNIYKTLIFTQLNSPNNFFDKKRLAFQKERHEEEKIMFFY